jgi:predicted dehydrogenase
MSQLVVAVVGAGAIAPFHIDALHAAGFRVEHVAASPGSARVAELASRFGISRVWSNPRELIESREWDALVLASATDSIPGLLESAMRAGRPCLVEKPVSFDPTEIRRFEGNDRDVRVAYNRRFYTVTQAAVEFSSNGPCVFRLELPDGISDLRAEYSGLRAVRENSVHGLDLLHHVVGPYQIVVRLDTNEPRGRIAAVTTARGHVGTIVLNWNCPANFALVLDRAPARFEMRPFEMGSLYEGMDVLEPNDEVPVRRYVPKLVRQINSFPGPDGIKPGFLDQARSLMSRVVTGEWDSRSATIADAAFAADVARALTAD